MYILMVYILMTSLSFKFSFVKELIMWIGRKKWIQLQKAVLFLKSIKIDPLKCDSITSDHITSHHIASHHIRFDESTSHWNCCSTIRKSKIMFMFRLGKYTLLKCVIFLQNYNRDVFEHFGKPFSQLKLMLYFTVKNTEESIPFSLLNSIKFHWFNQLILHPSITLLYIIHFEIFTLMLR